MWKVRTVVWSGIVRWSLTQWWDLLTGEEADQELERSKRVSTSWLMSNAQTYILPALTSAGTSMISLIIPPKGQISQIQNMLTQEYGTASNIKSRVNRLSVLAAITSTQQRLKLYNRVPPNGLVLFVGTILTDDGKEKKVSFDFEPHKPINT